MGGINIRQDIKKSYGQYNNFTALSEKIRAYFYEREIKAIVKKFVKQTPNIQVLDIGCGYYAKMLQAISPYIERGVGVDLQLSDTLSSNEKIVPINKPYDEALQSFSDETFDVILLISVLEHLEDPLSCLKDVRRILKKDGLLIINVPTWRSKSLLEFMAFTLKISEDTYFGINDHKMYYNKSDLWKLLIQSGFTPKEIKLRYHKFWLALFGICHKEL